MGAQYPRIGFARRMATRFFDSTCTIRREGVDLTGPNDDGTYPCSVATMAVGGRIDGEYVASNSWRLNFAVGTDVRLEDHILERGRTFMVIDVPSPESIEVYMDVICQRIG